MPDRFELLRPVDNQNNNGPDTIGNKFQREYELLRDGLSNGVVDRVTHMANNLGETAETIGICAGVGMALNLASRAGGRWGTAAKIGTGVLGVVALTDVARRAVPTFGAIGDTWSSGANLEENKQTVAKYAGSALVDYPVMLAAGYGGYKLGGLGPKATVVEVMDLSALKNIKDPLTPGAKALLEAGLPINPATRGAMQSPKLLDLPVPQRADAVRALTSKPVLEPIKLDAPATPATNAPKLDAAKFADILAAKPSAVPKDLLGPTFNQAAKGLEVPGAKPVEGAAVPGNLGSKAPKFEWGKDGSFGKNGPSIAELNIKDFGAKIAENGFNTRYMDISVKSRVIVPTIIPYDLLHTEQIRLGVIGKVGQGAAQGALDAIGNKPQAQPKVEQAPAPREVKEERLELKPFPPVKLQDMIKDIENRPGAFIQRNNLMMDHIEVNPWIKDNRKEIEEKRKEK